MTNEQELGKALIRIRTICGAMGAGGIEDRLREIRDVASQALGKFKTKDRMNRPADEMPAKPERGTAQTRPL